MNLLSYATHYTSLQTNLLASEAFLDSATLRSSIISQIKPLTYLPNQQVGSTAQINIRIPISSVPTGTRRVTVDSGTMFSATLAGTTLPFYVEQTSTLIVDTDNSISGNVSIRQGLFPNGINPEQRFVFQGLGVVDNLGRRQRFILSNTNIDINSLEVIVQGEIWENGMSSPNLISPGNNIFFLQETEDGQIEIFFGDNIIGNSPETNDIINVNYSTSSGPAGNNYSEFNLISSIGSFTPNLFSISTITNSEGGAAKETDSSIKLNAPAYFETQGRAVVDSDYSSLIRRIHPDIKSISAYGGNRLTPAIPGRVFVSIQTISGFPLSPSAKSNIISQVNRLNVGRITTEIIDNNYIDVNITSNVLIDPDRTDMTDNAFIEAVINRINTYFNDVVGLHNANLVMSRLGTQIDQVNTAVIGNTTSFELTQQLILSDQQVGNYTINFGNELVEGSFIITLNPPTTTLESFSGIIEDSGTKDSQGRNILIGRNIVNYPELDGVNYGTVDNRTGLVQLTNFRPSRNLGTAVTVSASTMETSVEATLNTLFRVGTLNINIERQ